MKVNYNNDGRIMLSIQKASALKRISAGLLDAIVLSILSLGFTLIISAVTGYDAKSQRLQDLYSRYESAYSVDFDVTEQQYKLYSEEQSSQYDKAYEALINDAEVLQLYPQILNLTVLMISLGLFLSCLIAEFIVPLILGNGMTLGKKVFSIALMHDNGVRVDAVALFIRTILGKYTVEIMIPALILIMIFFNTIGLVGAVVLGLILLLQAILFLATGNRTLIHDLLARTVCVDYASQRIYASQATMLEAIRQEAQRKAEEKEY